MRLRNWKKVLAVLGVSIMLSGCLEIEATTTVLEDGRVIDTMVVQPKNSMLAFLALSARDVNTEDRFSKVKRLKILQELRTLGNVCNIADEIFKEVLAKQNIPYSAAPVPTKFKFSEIEGNGCSVQIGPYDPRTLPAEFAEENLGIRIEPVTGLHKPYRMTYISIDETSDELPSSALMDEAAVQTICSGELEPALCQKELRILVLAGGNIGDIIGNIIGNRNKEADKFGDILSDPGMLDGATELLRMVLKSAPVTWRIPDNTAVRMVHSTLALERDQGWIWRGSFLDVITDTGTTSLEIRPTRRPAPSTR